jgi:hypothetical protein
MDQSHGLRRRPLHDAVWHALIGDQEHGPMSRAQVLAYLRSGTLKGNDLVWRPGFEKWLLLREVQEFWQPPPLSQQQAYGPTPVQAADSDVVAPSPLPLEVNGPMHELDERWSLWGAASVGLVLSVATLWMGALTTEGYELASYAHAPTADSISYLLG